MHSLVDLICICDLIDYALLSVHRCKCNLDIYGCSSFHTDPQMLYAVHQNKIYIIYLPYFSESTGGEWASNTCFLCFEMRV